MNFYLFIRVWLHQNWQIVLLVGRYHMNSSTVQCYCVFFWTDGTCNCPVEINFKRAQFTLRNLKSSISDWRINHICHVLYFNFFIIGDQIFWELQWRNFFSSKSKNGINKCILNLIPIHWGMCCQNLHKKFTRWVSISTASNVNFPLCYRNWCG